MIALIGGDPRRFRPVVDLDRDSADGKGVWALQMPAGRRAGHPPEQLRVGVHAIGYVAPSLKQAIDEFAPGYIEGLNKAGRERDWAQ